MKKTSRRTFGKQLTAAVVALPLGTALNMAQPSGKSKTAGQGTPEKKNEHNTPPPLYFMEGSLIIEAFTERDDWSANEHDQNNHRRKWSIVPKPYEHLPNMPPTNLYIEHVKVVDGAGEMIKQIDNDTDKSPIEIIMSLEKSDGTEFGDCKVSVTADHYVIDVPDDKKLKKKSSPSNPRRKRIHYMKGTDDQCLWKSLRILKDGHEEYYNPDLPRLRGYKEMRLMIWWTNR